MDSLFSQDSLSELVKIGNHLYKMIFVIYQNQFQSNVSPVISDEEAKLSDLLLEERSDVNALNNSMHTSPIFPSSKSFSTLCPKDSSATPSSDPFIFYSFDDDQSFESDLTMSKRKTQRNCSKDDELQQLFYPQKQIAKEEMKFFCKFCGFATKTKQHLGGHISKNHPGMGENSKKRIKAKRKRDYNSVIHQSIVAGNFIDSN